MIHTKLHVDLAWLNRVSMNLERFTKVKTDTFNCRCPLCGDSKKSKRAARFYFYVRSGNMNAYCHNCGYSRSFYNFMSDAFPLHFEEYKKETLFDVFKTKRTRVKVKSEVVDLTTVPQGIKFADFKRMTVCLADLPTTHLSRQVMERRGLGEAELRRLYFVEDFAALSSVMNAEAAAKMVAEPRVVIPFVSTAGYVEMMQGRDILDGNPKFKYLSVKAHDDVVKTYGLYERDVNRTTYCVEGPIDSLFVENCLASCDANLTRVPADVYIWDCEPRSRETCAYMEAAIKDGKTVVIWPFGGTRKIDINDMIMTGVSRDRVMQIIKENSYTGLTAKMKFIEWRKV